MGPIPNKELFNQILEVNNNVEPDIYSNVNTYR